MCRSRSSCDFGCADFVAPAGARGGQSHRLARHWVQRPTGSDGGEQAARCGLPQGDRSVKQCQAYSAPASLCGDVRWQGTEMGSAPLGAIAERVLSGDVPLRYYLYTPRECAPRGLVVCVHGISRNACEHVTILWPFAERWGLALAAPLFTDPPFRGYQRLGWAAGSARADLALTQMVEVVARLVDV